MTIAYSADATQMDVRYVAHLARLQLTEAEAAMFQRQLEQVIGYVNELREVDTAGVEPTAHAVRVENVLRADAPKACLDRADVLRNAPQQRHEQFVVPKIIE